MAITQAVCSSFKQELLVGAHNFTTTTGHVFKIALYLSTATLGAGTTAYATSQEVSSSGTAYTAGGNTITSITPVLYAGGTTAVCDFDPSSTWPTSSFTARGALIYNSSASNKAVVVLDFGADKTSTAGDFTIVFPPPDNTQAIIRIA